MKVAWENRRTIFGFVKEGLGMMLGSKETSRDKNENSPAVVNAKKADDHVNRPSIVSAR